MYKCAYIFSTALCFFTGASAMLPWQKTEVIQSIWVVPLFGSFGPVECPTYVTDTIYFNGTTNLIGGSSYMPTVDRLMVNGTRYDIIPDNELNLDQFYSRHVDYVCSSIFTDNGLDTMFITYDSTIDGTTYDPSSTNNKKRTITLEKQPDNGILSFKILTYEPSTGRSCTIKGAIPKKIYTQEYSKENKSFTTISKAHPDTIIHSTRKPHALFIKNGNLHTIKEEKLSLPILGLFLPTVFLIRYYDVQLTEQFTDPNYPAPCVKMLRKNPFGWANVIRTVNGLFLIFVAYVALPYIYKMS